MNKNITIICGPCFVNFNDKKCSQKVRIFPPFRFYVSEETPNVFTVYGVDEKSFTIPANRKDYTIDNSNFTDFEAMVVALEMKLCRYNENSPAILEALEGIQTTLSILTLSQASSIASLQNDDEAEICVTPPETINYLPGTLLTNEPTKYNATSTGIEVVQAGLYLAISSLTPRRTAGGNTRTLDFRTTVNGVATAKPNIVQVEDVAGGVDSISFQFSELLNLTAGQQVGTTSEHVGGSLNGVELVATEGRLVLLKLG